MSTTATAIGGFGKRAPSQGGERFPQIGETSVAVINAIKGMYENPAVVFGRWLGISDKTAKRKLGHERCLTAEELGILIRSERGFEIVAAIMGESRPKWWRLVVPIMDAASAREMQLVARRRLEKTIESAVNAHDDLTTTIRRAEALQDQDHARPYADALRSFARSPDSAVVAKRKR